MLNPMCKIFPVASSITAQNWAEENQFLLYYIIRWSFKLILILVPSCKRTVLTVWKYQDSQMALLPKIYNII